MNNNRREQSDKTVERILTSARSVFAAKGYNGARMDEIAELASVNKATIYYQIGDKDTLYTVVIHQAIGNVARGIARAVSLADAPEEKLKAYITFIAAAVDKNPDLPPIMMRELASGGATLPRLVIEDIASVLMILAGVLEEGKEKGLFMMIMGTILFYKKGTPIKDRQSWLPETVKVYDIKLSANLGEEVASLVLKAIRR
jgi:AcrR family transcriptional regulator